MHYKGMIPGSLVVNQQKRVILYGASHNPIFPPFNGMFCIEAIFRNTFVVCSAHALVAMLFQPVSLRIKIQRGTFDEATV